MRYLLLVFCSFSFVSVIAQQPGQNEILVGSRGEELVAPDFFIGQFTISMNPQNPVAAETFFAQIDDFFRDQKLLKRVRLTSNNLLHAQMNNYYNNADRTVVYALHLKDMEEFRKIQKETVTSNSNCMSVYFQMSFIGLSKEHLNAGKLKAFQAALQLAKTKMELVEETLSQPVGTVVKIQEGGYGDNASSQTNYLNSYHNYKAASPNSDEFKISIITILNVTFALGEE